MLCSSVQLLHLSPINTKSPSIIVVIESLIAFFINQTVSVTSANYLIRQSVNSIMDSTEKAFAYRQMSHVLIQFVKLCWTLFQDQWRVSFYVSHCFFLLCQMG